MKTRILVTTLITTMCIFMFTTAASKAQTIVLDDPQSLAVSGPGFFPFSNISNDQFIEVFPTNPVINCEFSGFTAGPLTIAPAMDFSEIGDPINIMGSTDVDLDFSGASSTMGAFGISLVPTSGPSVFTINCMLPQVVTSSSSSSSGSVATGEDDELTPNALTVFSNFLPDDLVDTLSNENDNPMCQSSPSGINPNGIQAVPLDDFFGSSLSDPSTINRIVRYLSSKKDSNTFTLLQTTPKQSKTVYNQKIQNKTDKTRIFVTGIFPSNTGGNNLLSRSTEPEANFTPMHQSPNLIALAAVQHSIISATMPWQLGGANSAFIVSGGGCVGPFCTIVEQGMVTIIPGGACTPEKLSKRRIKNNLVNPSKLFDPFPASQNTILLPSSSVVNPKHPNVSTRVNKDNSYLIFQPVPPTANLKQQLKVQIQQSCPQVVACDKLCSNAGACCKADKNGNAAKVCAQTGKTCSCK